MNRKVSDCDIVLELLPLYIEKKTGQESNSFVAAHLAECKECREAYEFMSADWLAETRQAEVGDFDAETRKAVAASDVKGETKQPMQDGASRKWFQSKILWVIVGLLGYAGLMAGIVIYIFFYLTGL